MSIRLQILKALTAYLEEMTPTAGFEYDLSLEDAVSRGRNLIGSEIKVRPALSIIEAPTPDVASFTGEWLDFRRDTWTILIQGLVKDDKKNPSDPAYYMADDVTKWLGRLVATRNDGSGRTVLPADKHLLGGLITSLEIAPPVVRNPDDKISATAFFYLPIRVGVVDDLANG